MGNTATIKLIRRSSLAAGGRRLDVLIDGKKIGNIGNGKEEKFELGPGQHSVQVKLMSRSELIDLDLASNSYVELECGIAQNFWTRNLPMASAFIVWYATGRRLDGIWLGIVGTCVIVFLLIAMFNFRPGGTYYLKRLN